jgi:heat shock protein HtpX
LFGLWIFFICPVLILFRISIFVFRIFFCMWELISANKRNSVILMAAMAICLLLLGAVGGAAMGDPFIGLAIAAGIWGVMSLVSYFGGDQILLSSSGAVPVVKEVHPQLFNVVEEMTIAAGLNKMPAIYIINDPAPNAFATGRNPQTASIAVTAGLLATLNRDELQGVVAHEMSHIIHRDILYVTIAGVMLGAISILANIYLRGFLRGGSSLGRRTSGKGGGQAQLVMFVVAIVLAILAPILAQLLYFALSRSREYMADGGGARLTRYPEGLASALEKIATSPTHLDTANKATAPMYIVNPFMQAKGRSIGLMSTHPPIEKRIAILRSMMHGANWKDYSDAYATVTHKKLGVPAAALKDDKPAAIRAASQSDTPPATDRQQTRQAADIMRMVSGFAFLTCPCGLKMKVPPAMKGKTIRCPRCDAPSTIPA